MLSKIARFEVFMAIKIQVELFWVVTWCSVVVGNVGILSQHYTASQPRIRIK